MARIGLDEAVGLLGERYPGVGGMLPGIGREGRLRGQYEARLETAEGLGVDYVARYGKVEFREPYREAYLESADSGEISGELARLAGEGYSVVGQTFQLGIVDGTVYGPAGASTHRVRTGGTGEAAGGR